ncbi:aminotransferase-like domain-containing protein [Roseobacter sp. CCS2]|uniref:aminotransferase-like domain-containing protein n=1 Tax=Roseobacter sp. CCS2 TaxID=391593 RepID=UPI0000F3FBEA|nr:PLP-dependent aminotransferase family protein [Roseobacter sp. CCS2]EBA10840.1 transcriptional regulator, GntR family protein [Roseobacter sp. CCS2]
MIVSDTIWQPNLSNVGKSKYKALAQAIRDGIASGDLAEGSKLPTVRDLAYRVGVTPGTVARAYSLLTDEGRLRAEVGRGTYVAGATRTERALEEPSLVHLVDESTADFRSSRVPDVGQGLLIDDALIRLGQSHRRRHINYPTPNTDIEAREAVVDWIGPVRAGHIDAQHVVLGNGAQNCVILTLQAELHGAHPVILTDELAYPGVRHAARLVRAQLIGVAMDEDGIIPAALADAYRTHGGQVLLTSAEVHSPTTTQTSYARKKEIAALAERFGLTIIEDDCHSIAPTEVPAYRAILPKQSYFISSLTKGVSGALRFGYAVTPVNRFKDLQVVAQSSFHGIAQPMLDVCADLLTSGDAGRIKDKVIAHTAERVRLAVNRLGGWDVRWREDAPFLWLQLPQGWRASSFALACERKGISVRPADEFVLSDQRAPNAVRLAATTCVSEPRYLQALDDMNTLLANPAGTMES